MAVTYYLGVDGGTTRTKAVVSDEAGHIVGSGEGGASNYQVVGIEAAVSGITDAVQHAVKAADLSISRIECAVFGLSGMDLPMHREVLEAALKTAFPGLVFDLVNDTWIMLRAGSFCHPEGARRTMPGQFGHLECAVPEQASHRRTGCTRRNGRFTCHVLYCCCQKRVVRRVFDSVC